MLRRSRSWAVEVLAITGVLMLIIGVGWRANRATATHVLRGALHAAALPCLLTEVETQWKSPSAARRAGVVVPEAGCDLVAALHPRGGGRYAFLGVDLSAMIVLPASVGLGLALGTPVAFGRRLRCAVIVVAILAVILFLRIDLVLVETALAGDAPLVQASATFRTIVSAAASALVHPPATRFIIPLLVWLTVAWPMLRCAAGSDVATGESTSPPPMP